MRPIIRVKYEPYKYDVAARYMTQCIKQYCANEYNGNTRLIRSLVHYAMCSPYVSELIDQHKALCFYGGTGSGKTITMRGLSDFMRIKQHEVGGTMYGIRFIRNSRYQDFAFDVIHMRKILQAFTNGGFDTISSVLRCPVICIDDVGTEDVALSYGNRVDLFAHIIESRYDDDLVTHLTTNLQPEQLRQRYGDRVYSRLIETTQFIDFGNYDFRNNN